MRAGKLASSYLVERERLFIDSWNPGAFTPGRMSTSYSLVIARERDAPTTSDTIPASKI